MSSQQPNKLRLTLRITLAAMVLLAAGATYLEVPVRTVELKGGNSRALTFKNWLSVSHTLATIFLRRLSNWIYG